VKAILLQSGRVLSMKFFPPDKMNFIDQVQAFFLERTQKGIVLSSRDVALLYGWRAQGATVTAVCLGIEDAIGAMMRPPRDLHACRKYVDKRVGNLEGLGSSGQEEQAPRAESGGCVERAQVRIERVREQVERPGFRAAYERVAIALTECRALSDGDALGEIVRLEETLFEELFAALSTEERDGLDSCVQDSQRAELDRMSAAARGEHMQSWRRRILLERYGLPALSY
jgi:hypothetical protein